MPIHPYGMTRLLVFLILTGLAWAENAALPLAFIPNAGQVDPSIRFLVQAPEVRAAFSRDSADFQIAGIKMRLRFIDSNPDVDLEGSGPLAGRANFLIGSDPDGWRTDLPLYRQLIYSNLYPGIDAVFGSTKLRLKSEFHVRPGADPRRIQLQYSGIVRLDEGGQLLVVAEGTELREEAPVAQQQDGRAVHVAFRLIDEHTVGFDTADYDRTQTLTIDPTITYSTYLGGSGMGSVTGVAIDSSGSLYAAGWTEALDFPIAGALQASNRGGVDAFVVKLNPTGDALIYAT